MDTTEVGRRCIEGIDIEGDSIVGIYRKCSRSFGGYFAVTVMLSFLT